MLHAVYTLLHGPISRMLELVRGYTLLGMLSSILLRARVLVTAACMQACSLPLAMQ